MKKKNILGRQDNIMNKNERLIVGFSFFVLMEFKKKTHGNLMICIYIYIYISTVHPLVLISFQDHEEIVSE
jgi:hypothetical protein